MRGYRMRYSRFRRVSTIARESFLRRSISCVTKIPCPSFDPRRRRIEPRALARDEGDAPRPDAFMAPSCGAAVKDGAAAEGGTP